MARYIVKEMVYNKNGLFDHRKVLKEFTDLKEARKYAYNRVQGTDRNVEIYQFTSDKTPPKHICWIWYRDFGKLYPYGKWTYCTQEGKERMLNADGSINKKSERTIIMERKPDALKILLRKR